MGHLHRSIHSLDRRLTCVASLLLISWLAIGCAGYTQKSNHPGLSLSATSFNFQTVVVGQKATQTFKISNTGTAPLQISGSIGFRAMQFSRHRSFRSRGPFSLRNTFTYTLTFAPTTSGSASASRQHRDGTPASTSFHFPCRQRRKGFRESADHPYGCQFRQSRAEIDQHAERHSRKHRRYQPFLAGCHRFWCGFRLLRPFPGFFAGTKPESHFSGVVLSQGCWSGFGYTFSFECKSFLAGHPEPVGGWSFFDGSPTPPTTNPPPTNPPPTNPPPTNPPTTNPPPTNPPSTNPPTTNPPPTNPPPATQHTVALSWGASSSQVIGYRVYRSETSGGSYSPLNGTAVAALNYSDSTVASGTTYYYVVTAVDSSGTESAYSNQATAVIP